MKLITLLCPVLIFLFASSSFAQWVSLDKNSVPGTKPNVQLISSDLNSVVIKVDLPGYSLNEFSANNKIYHSIILDDDAAITTEAGLPEIPYISKILAIPDQGTINVEVLEADPVQVYKGVVISPARESWLEGKPETSFIENSDFYNSGNIFPQQLVSVNDPVVFRDFRLARVSIFPVRYSPSRNEIEAVSSITVRISFGAGPGINPKLTPQKPIAPSFDKLYQSTIFNYNEVLQQRYGGMVDGHDIMLCIMPDMYIEEFQPYADWKNKSGTEIIVTKFSDIGANQNNPAPIRDYILSVYNGSVNVPSHILLIGDYGSVVGCAPVSYSGSYVNEDYFVELEGNDYFPEMIIGRFTNHGTGGEYRLQVMINKFMSYERYPSTSGNEWYKKGIVCSNNAYQSQPETKRFAALEMMEFGGFTVDTMMSVYPYGCPYNLNDVKAAINNGRGFLNYRGEGWYYGWWANCYQFQTSDVTSLTNTNKLTFVTSIGCGVAMFDANEQSFGEEWTEMGSLSEEPRGACAFVGPTGNTHTAYNNYIDRGIYVGMFQEGLDSPGEALLRGKLYMYEHFGGSDPYVGYHYKIYSVLGDPSIHIWKEYPRKASVDYPSEIYVGFNQVQVTVTDSITGTPVDHARVCIIGNGIYETGTTDFTGTVILAVTPVSEGTLDVTVTGRNVVPVEKTIQVSIGTENVTLHGNPDVTDLDGNDDGLINPNENCSITFTLKNWGTITSNNVYALLSVPDSINYVDVTVDSIYFGNIAPGDSVTGTAYQFFITPECPVGFVIPFKLDVVSTTSNWNYSDNEIVHGCILNFSEIFIDDEGNILHNLRMDPGETVNVKFKIINSGDDNAPDVKGIISTNDPYMTILDSVAEYGVILPDSNSINQSDTYTITVSENCPIRYNSIFTFKLLTQNGLYPYTVNRILTLPVAMPIPSDPTGPDQYGYYAYSNEDSLWSQSPEFNWVEINGIGTEIPKPSNLDYFRKILSLPFNFKYYGNNITSIGVNGDGWISFGGDTLTKMINTPLPNQDNITGMAAAFWDELFSNAAPASGKLLYYFDSNNHRFIIEWYNVPHTSDVSNKEYFEIILLDPVYFPTQTGDGEIIFQYFLVDEPGSCTVGIENISENQGLQYLFNEVYDATANELVTGLAIKFTTKLPTIVSVENNEVKNEAIPTEYSLEQNYPNPFNPSTKINYSIPLQGFVRLNIYDINGSLTRTLLEKNQQPGRYEVTWDGKNQNGVQVSSSVYFYRLQANDFIQVRKMILLK